MAAEAIERVVVSESFVRRAFPETNPIGRRFELKGDSVEIIGVAAEARTRKIAERLGAEVYLSYEQKPNRWRYPVTFFIRCGDEISGLAKTLRESMGRVAPLVEIRQIAMMEETISRLTKYERMTATIASALAVVSTVLAGVGLHALLAYALRRQTKELGIRLALGGSAKALGWLMVKRGLGMSIVGCVVGCILSYYAGRFIEDVLFEVEPYSIELSVVIFVILIFIAFLSSAAPAIRCMRIDPIVALREQ